MPLQDIHWTLTNLTLSTRRSTASPGQLRKPCSYVYRTPSQLQHRKIPTASYMGPTATVIASVSTQTNISTNHHCQHVPPYWYPPHTLTHPSSPTVHLGRGASYFSLVLSTMVSTCIHLPTTPPLLIYTQYHLGKFLYNIWLD